MLLAVVIAAIAPGAAAAAPSFRDGFGLHVTSVKRVDGRLFALMVRTAALPSPANVYILLPPNYGKHRHRRFPVLYLLHGTSGTASNWTAKGAAERVIGDRRLITVMPDIALDGSGGGFCTDWPNGAQSWERFHIEQLLPWVDRNLRTIRARGGRAIAGLSQGGFCSMSYAARHPDLFGTALGYSGGPDIYYDQVARVGVLAVVNGIEVGLDGVPADTFFGDPVSNGLNWAAHDPATLAPNLRWTHIDMYWGNGQPGPFDHGSPIGADLLEQGVWEDNHLFENRIESLGISAYFDDYGRGTHSWPYWTRDLEWSIDKVMLDFAHPVGQPSQFTYASADDAYSVYDWQVRLTRTAREFSTLTASATRFALGGSGSATVLTPPRFRPGKRFRVTLVGDRVAARTIAVRAGRDRRLRIVVPLGPSNPYQQDTVQAQAAGTAVYNTTVTIAPRRKH